MKKLIILVLVLSLTGMANAGPVNIWDGTVSNDIEDGNNWSLGYAPAYGSLCDPQIGAGATYDMVTSSSLFKVESFRMGKYDEPDGSTPTSILPLEGGGSGAEGVEPFAGN